MKYIDKIIQHHRVQRVKKMPIYLIYLFNFFIINFFGKKYDGILEKKLLIKKINIDDNFHEKVALDLQKKDQKLFGKSKNYFKYLYYTYPMSYLKEVKFAWNINRKFYVDFLDVHFGETIKKIYNGHNYRVEHIFMHETLNNDKKETHNMNSKFHYDVDMPGAIKILIYLTDVDKDNGPFVFKENSKSEAQYITGEIGTSIIFLQNQLLHAGSNTKLKKRVSISFLIYPTIRKDVIYSHFKPIDSLCSINPFTKTS